jgi:hypothetical protein
MKAKKLTRSKIMEIASMREGSLEVGLQEQKKVRLNWR